MDRMWNFKGCFARKKKPVKKKKKKITKKLKKKRWIRGGSFASEIATKKSPQFIRV